MYNNMFVNSFYKKTVIYLLFHIFNKVYLNLSIYHFPRNMGCFRTGKEGNR